MEASKPLPKRGYDVVDGLLDSTYDSDEEHEKKKQRKAKALADEHFHVVDQLEQLCKEGGVQKGENLKTANSMDIDDEKDNSEKLEAEEENLAQKPPKMVKIKKKKEKTRSVSEEVEPEKSAQKSAKPEILAPPTLAPPTLTTTATTTTKSSRTPKSAIQPVLPPKITNDVPAKKPMPPVPGEPKQRNTGCCVIL